MYTVQVNPNNGTVQASYAEQAATVPVQVQDSRIYVDEAVFSRYLDTAWRIPHRWHPRCRRARG